MQKRLIITLLITFAHSINADMFCMDAEVYSGYRWDCIDMKNPGTRKERPIRDNAKFDNIGIWEIGGKLEIDGPCNLFANFDGNYGKIQQGHFRLKERYADGLQEIDFFAYDPNICGQTYELKGYVGYCIDYMCHKMLFSPLIGYVYYSNDYEIINADFGPFDEFEKPLEPFHGGLKNNSKGVSFGFDAAYFVFSCFRVFGNFRYEWLRYHANGNGHVAVMNEVSKIRGLQEFSNKAHLRGPVFQIGGDLFRECSFYLGILFEYRHLHACNGSEKNTHSSIVTVDNVVVQENETKESVDLDHLRWNTKRLQAYIGWYF